MDEKKYWNVFSFLEEGAIPTSIKHKSNFRKYIKRHRFFIRSDGWLYVKKNRDGIFKELKVMRMKNKKTVERGAWKT